MRRQTLGLVSTNELHARHGGGGGGGGGGGMGGGGKANNKSRLSMVPRPKTASTATGNMRSSMASAIAGDQRRQSSVSSRGQSTATTGRPSAGRGGSNSRASMGTSAITSGSSRRSSVFGKSASSKMRDMRPLNDKVYMTQSIRNLIRFVAANGYNYPLSPKLLTTPTSKDFVRIFQFLYHQIEPSYEFSPKFEDEIPMLFRRLRYPFTINKSALFSVGSMHTWPGLLGSLTWLVELITVYQGTDLDKCFYSAPDDFDDGATSNDNQVFFEYLGKAYTSYLAGDDQWTSLDDDLHRSFHERLTSMKAEKDRIANQVVDIQNHLKDAKDKPSELELMNKNKIDLLSDRSKFLKHIESLNAYMSSNQQKLLEQQQIEGTLRDEMTAIATEKERLQGQLATQELSSTDVERINMDRSKLEDSLRLVADQKENLSKESWSREMAISKKLEDIERQVHAYNKRCESMSLIPMNAKWAGGTNFELCMAFNAPHPEQMLSVDLKGVIKPALIKLKGSIQTRLHEENDEQLVNQERLDQIQDMVSEKEDEVTILDARVSALEEQWRAEKDHGIKEYSSRAGDLATLEQDLQRLRMGAHQGLSESMRALEKARLTLDETRMRHQTSKDDYNRLIVQTLDLVTTHKGHIQGSLADLKVTVSEVSMSLNN